MIFLIVPVRYFAQVVIVWLMAQWLGTIVSTIPVFLLSQAWISLRPVGEIPVDFLRFQATGVGMRNDCLHKYRKAPAWRY